MDKSILTGVYFYTACRLLFRYFDAQSSDTLRKPLIREFRSHTVYELFDQSVRIAYATRDISRIVTLDTAR